jgi:predicted PurR-regulated permease PerM
MIIKKSHPQFYRPFLLALIAISVILVFYLFRPFLAEIIIAAILASVFYKWYKYLVKKLWKKKYLAAFLISFALLLLIVVPTVNLLIYGAKQAPIAYQTLNQVISNLDLNEALILDKFGVGEESEAMIKNFILDTTKGITDWLVGGATIFVKNTSNFLISLIIVIVTTFFFLVNGEKIVKQLSYWSPLPNKYDQVLVNTFKTVSYNNLLALFVAALVQGSLSALGFVVIGWPFFFVFIISAFLSIIPYMLGLFFVPIIVYLFASGQIWQALVIIIWNLIIVVNLDEFVRAYIVKGKSHINMIFVVFAIIGGISIFGFWGIFIGPLILSLVVAVLQIYELEFAKQLAK